MTRLLLKLHRTLWWRNVKNNTSIAMIAVLIILYTVIGLISINYTMTTEFAAARWHALSAAVGIGTAAYAIAAMVFPNGENQITPAQLAAQPLGPKDVLPAMGWASVLTSRGVAAVLATVVTAIVTFTQFSGSGHLVAAIAAVPVFVVALLTTIILGELVASFNRGGSRRSKELTNILTLVLGFGAIFGFNMLMGSMGEIPLADYGPYLAWTPLAAAPGALASAMSGAWVSAALQAAIAVATIVVGTWLWRHFTLRELVAPLDVLSDDSSNQQPTTTARGGTPLLVPGTTFGPAGMIYSRALRYLRRDSRSMGTLIVMPIFIVLFVAQGIMIDKAVMLFGMAFMGAFVAMTAVNDFGYDGPGIASYSLAGVPARTVVVARHLASITVPFLFLVLYAVILLVVQDDKAIAFAVVVGSLGLALAASGISAFLSAYNPYPMSRPGTNPWADKSGNTAAAYISAFASLFICWIPVAPGVALTAFAWDRSAALVITGMVLMVVLPAAMYAGALALASRRYDTHFPEIYAKVGKWVN